MPINDTFEHVRLSGLFTARSPISHIGESVSTTSYLAQDPIVQPDGSLVEVFSYSGNAWRGQLRDLMARRTAQTAGSRLPADSFHLLFSGGRLDQAEKGVDLETARAIRAAVPMLSLLGGGIGSQILCGRLRVFNSYPVCREAIPVLPAHLHAEASRIRYGALTFEREFTRFDDAKREDGRTWLEAAPEPKAKKTGPEQQMRMGAELVAPGARLYTEIHGMNLSRADIGCLVVALEDFAASPCIGGQANRGHGLVSLSYALTGDVTDPDFVLVDENGARLSMQAHEFREEYLAHLAASVDEIRATLKCAA